MMIYFCIMLVFIKKIEPLLFDLAHSTSKVTYDQVDVVTREMLDDLGLAEMLSDLLMMFKKLELC